MTVAFRHASLLSAALIFSFLFQATACREDDDTGVPIDMPAVCDSTLTPIIFVHGFLASGDTYAGQVQRFSSNKYCGDWLYAFDWNTLGQQALAVTQLDALIDEVLQQTGASQVHLAGHSAGGGLCYSYLSDAGRAAKVARYAHLGSSQQVQPAGPSGEVPTINIWSEGDKVVQGADIPGAENVRFTEYDHYQAATSDATFTAMYQFFNGNKMPETSAALPQDKVALAGRVVTLGENQPQVGATVEIYEVDPATGMRLRAVPDATFTADDKGAWGPWETVSGKPYEFFVRSVNAGDRPIHYYREGFSRTNSLIYLRMFPPPSSLAGLLLAGIPKDDSQSVLAVFTANQAAVYQRDQLSVNGFDLAVDAYASAQRTTIAFFLYDDGDGQSSGNVHAAFNFLPAFLVGVDYRTPSAPSSSVELQFNGRKQYVPNWKSDSEGVIVAVFD